MKKYLVTCGIQVPIEIVQILLDAGADPNIPDWDGHSPFQETCWNSDADSSTPIIKILLDAGATISSLDGYGWTPYETAK